MLKHFSIFIFIFVFVTTSFTVCPNGFIQFYTDPTLCFLFNADKIDFINAEGICINSGGHLASVHSIFENLFLSEKARLIFTDSTTIDFWIGANNIITPGIWSWMDSTSFDFTDWEKGQPQNLSGSDCGAIKIQDEKWISDDCDKQKSFVCLVHVSEETTTTIKTTAKMPQACPPAWTYFNTTNSCYKVFSNETWINAEDRCKIDNAHLVSIHSYEEQLFVAGLADYPGAAVIDPLAQSWIGLYTEDDNAHWNWTDNTQFDYLDWYPGEPNFPGLEDCTAMYPTAVDEVKIGQVINLNCHNILARFVCKLILP